MEYTNVFDALLIRKQNEIDELADKRAETIAALIDIRDLLRAGVAPDAFGMTPEQWAQHKCNRAAGEITRLIEKMEK